MLGTYTVTGACVMTNVRNSSGLVSSDKFFYVAVTNFNSRLFASWFANRAAANGRRNEGEFAREGCSDGILDCVTDRSAESDSAD